MPLIWKWQDYTITYESCGTTGPAVVLVHGFGASWGHWRKNIPILGETTRCYALDLIGFGASDKPTPGTQIDYTFDTWAQLVADFCREVVGDAAFLVGNSIGCVVVMQAAVSYPEVARGVILLNCSLRLLHKRKRAQLPWYRSFGAPVLQRILSNKAIGYFFFQQIAKPKVVEKILRRAYHRQDAVTQELVDILMQPAMSKGAADVFLAFTGYDDGPLPEELLPQLSCPTLILWGTKDPWEPVALGEELGKFSTVDRFVALEGLGHCPQDEAPEVVNPILRKWIEGVSAIVEKYH